MSNHNPKKKFEKKKKKKKLNYTSFASILDFVIFGLPEIKT